MVAIDEWIDDLKQRIDKLYSEPVVQRLMYWKYGLSTYNIIDQDLANDICGLLEYVEKLEDALKELQC